MNITLIYETYSSGTQTASHVLQQALNELGHQVNVIQARNATPQDIQSSETLILASPSWWVDDQDGQPHAYMKELFQKADDMDLTGKKCTVFGLGDSTYARFCGAVDHLVEFITSHNGSIIVDPLRVDEFYFHQKTNEENIRNWAKLLDAALKQ